MRNKNFSMWKQLQSLDRQITALDFRLRVEWLWGHDKRVRERRNQLDQRRKELRAKMKGAK